MGASVSVIVPTYKRPHYLASCLASLQAQTFEDFEVAVCDNAADGATEEVVARLGDPRFTYRPRRVNLGILGNVRQGFRETGAPLVMELDDDDFLAPTCLERLTAPFRDHPDIALAFADLEIVDSHGRPCDESVRQEWIQSSRRLHEGLYPDFTLAAARGYVFAVAAVIRRDAVDWGDIPESASTSYDRYIALAAARTGRGAYYVDERLASYRVHEAMDSATEFYGQLDGAAFVLDDARRQASASERRVLEMELANLRFERARYEARNRNWPACARSLGRALVGPAGLRYSARTLQRRMRGRRSVSGSGRTPRTSPAVADPASNPTGRA